MKIFLIINNIFIIFIFILLFHIIVEIYIKITAPDFNEKKCNSFTLRTSNYKRQFERNISQRQKTF